MTRIGRLSSHDKDTSTCTHAHTTVTHYFDECFKIQCFGTQTVRKLSNVSIVEIVILYNQNFNILIVKPCYCLVACCVTNSVA